MPLIILSLKSSREHHIYNGEYYQHLCPHLTC